jgi:hypothetical protein
MSDESEQVRVTDPRRARALLLCLDGLRYACGICAASYQRAFAILRSFEDIALQRMEVPEREVMLAVADIWTVVDSAYRARIIAARTPHLKRISREYDIFERNYIQHLDNEISTFCDHSTPVWGSISWQSDSDPRTAFTLMAANKLFKQSHVSLVYDTWKHKFVRPIELVVGKDTLDLDDIVQSVARLSGLLQTWTRTFTFENGGSYSYELGTVSLLKTTVSPPDAANAGVEA